MKSLGGILLGVLLGAGTAAAAGTFRAGAYTVDVTPRTFPIITSGGFLAATAKRAEGTLHARAVALESGGQRVVITVVDTLMMPREFLDRIKETVARSTGIPAGKMLISATHSHSTPPVMGALGTDENAEYARFLEERIVKAMEGAVRNLAPARAGWIAVEDAEHTHCRQWILRPDRIRKDPFGEMTIRSNMHPGYQHPDFIGPAGPQEPGLTLLSFQTPEGRPIALIAKYSMHYVGAGGGIVSPDYYGPFCENMQRLIGAQDGDRPCVAIMSQGTSGDQHWMDYSQPKKDMNLRLFADALAGVVHAAYRKIQYRDNVPIAMAEATITLSRRVPGPERLAWAKELMAKMGGAAPKSQPEVYAREAMYLAAEPRRELKLQALRIGELGIAAIPNEVFGITGLKIKAQSPLRPTFNIELANGADGYIPPPEHPVLGGYTTWPARTAGLEVNAEPKIVEAVLGLLEKVAGAQRRAVVETNGAYAKSVLAGKPLAYWRGNEFNGPKAVDATRRGNDGVYGDGVVFYLDGPESAGFSGGARNRSPHYAGGRMTAAVKGARGDYSVDLWFWNGMPAGCLFEAGEEWLSIGGAAGGVVFGKGEVTLEGRTPIEQRTWHHLALVRKGTSVVVYLDGKAEIAGEAPGAAKLAGSISIGGRAGGVASFAGKIDEVVHVRTGAGGARDRPAVRAGEVNRAVLHGVRPAGAAARGNRQRDRR
jgi:hypothetical protein